MSQTTTEKTYHEDFATAFAKMETLLDMSAYGGNQRNAAQDALANAWTDGISIDEWVNRARPRAGSNIRMI
jgi:hypothetical protein